MPSHQYILSRLEYHPFEFKSISLRRLSTNLSPIYSHNLLNYTIKSDDIDRSRQAFSRTSNTVVLLALMSFISDHNYRDLAALPDLPDWHRAI